MTSFLQTTPRSWGHAPCWAEAQGQSPGRPGVSPESFLVKVTNLLLPPRLGLAGPKRMICVLCALLKADFIGVKMDGEKCPRTSG